MEKKEESIDIRSLPQRKLSDIEKQFIFLETQKLNLRRESTRLILDKGVFLFLTAIAIAMLGVANGIISSQTLNFIVIMGLATLIISILPYQLSVRKEEEKIKKMIDDLIT